MIMEAEIRKQEDRLREAMLESSVVQLEDLLADDLLFTNHLGQITSKEADIAAHASGAVNIDSLDFAGQKIRLLADSVAVVVVQVRIAGTFLGHPASGTFRFTRVWRQENGRWRVIVGHSCIEAPSG